LASRSSRRDFLKGRPGDAAPAVPDSHREPETPGSPRTYLIHVARAAMACEFEALFNAGQYPDPSTAGVAALETIAALEEQMSYFRATSEITRLNALAAEGPVEVEPRLFQLLELATDLFRQTEGAFDIASAPLWEAWGFARREGRIPDAEQLAEARERVGGHLVELDTEKRTVRFQRPGVRLNLGSIGKGYALDRAAEVLAAAGIGDFLFHGGQSSMIARGSRMSDRAVGNALGGVPGPKERDQARSLQNTVASHTASPAAGWTVGVGHPLRPGERLAEIRLRDRALGTSAGTFQSFRHQGKRYGHILDPRTGRPAEGVLAVTVTAPTAALADGLSTAFFVMGPEPAFQFCREHPELAVLMVLPASAARGYRIESLGFAAEDLTVGLAGKT
jgi:thiamine biosynthesis lipoprotein